MIDLYLERYLTNLSISNLKKILNFRFCFEILLAEDGRFVCVLKTSHKIGKIRKKKTKQINKTKNKIWNGYIVDRAFDVSSFSPFSCSKSKWSSYSFSSTFNAISPVDSFIYESAFVKTKERNPFDMIRFFSENTCRYYTLIVCCQWLLLIFYRDNTLMLPMYEFLCTAAVFSKQV